MLYLSLSARSEHVVREAFGSVEAFQASLNEHPAWMYRQTDASMWVNGKRVAYPPAMILVSGNLKLILSLPLIQRDGENACHHIIAIKTPNRYDRADALAGEELKESIVVQDKSLDSRPHSPPIKRPKPPTPTPAPTPMATVPPTLNAVRPQQQTISKTVTRQNDRGYEDDRQRFIVTPTCPVCANTLVPDRGVYCQTCGHKLPQEIAVHREVVVSIRIQDYARLAKYLIQKVNRALSRLMMGRKLSRVVMSMGQRILLVEVADEMRTSTVSDEERLNELLTETAVGRLSSDLYEIRQAHEMFDSESSKPVP